MFGDGDIEIHVVVGVVGLGLAQIPGNAAGAQIRAGEAPVHGLFRVDDADVHRPLLEDAVFGKQGFQIVDDARITLRPGVNVFRETGGHVIGNAARTKVVHVHARAANPLAELHEDFPFLEAPEHRRHRPHVHGVGGDVEDMVQDAANFAI